MNIKLYFDAFPGMQPEYAAAYSNPSAKVDGTVRYRLEFSIPDPTDKDTVPVPVTVFREEE